MEEGSNHECFIPIMVPNGIPLSIPKYFRFKPNDDELVSDFLLRKCCSLPLIVDMIAEVDIYKFNPWELSDKSLYGEKEWYFFTPRERKYPNSFRPNRFAGMGYWKATGVDKKIGHPKVLGIKKSLVFYVGKHPKAIKTNWLMQEYRVADVDRTAKVVPSKASRLDEWVLVCVYHKKGMNERYDLPQTDLKEIGTDLEEVDTNVVSDFTGNTSGSTMTSSNDLELLGIETNADNIEEDTLVDELELCFPSLPNYIDNLSSYPMGLEGTILSANNPFNSLDD